MPLNPDDSASSQEAGRILEFGRQVVQRERDGLDVVLKTLDDAFVSAVHHIRNGQGRVAVTGMGKAGLIGAKISATLSSTGTPAFVLHPVEAIHGDLGMIREDDVILALSNSGESDELVALIPLLKGFGCTVILVCGRPESRCAQASDIVLDIGTQVEACPLGMAPSTSTTAMLALGDALALALSDITGFAREQYAAVHPGGALGRSLMRVEEIMRTGERCPTLLATDRVADFLELITRVRTGAAAVVDDTGGLVGFFSLGDLGRLVTRKPRPGEALLHDVMTPDPKCVQVGQRVAEALQIMRGFQIDEIPVVDDQRTVQGLIDIQDVLARGFSLLDAG
jgi:arabinose-5-phosphate isomerase